jgi:putative transposase
MDLRERAMARRAAGESTREIAEALSIGPSSVVKWEQRLKATGSVCPGQMGGHCPPKIAGEHRDWLVERITATDFTLRGLVAELAERGLEVDYRTVWNFVHGQGLSFKKKWGAPMNRAGRMWRDGGRGGKRIKAASTRRAWSSSMRRG